jgi:hypothetical protein
MNPATHLFPPMKKKEENKVLYQNVFFKKIKGTNHLTIKKKWGIKIYFTNKFENATYVIHVFHLSPISFNSTLPKKKLEIGC